MSGLFIPRFSHASSDPKLIGVMDSAYAKACKMLHDKGQPDVVQEVMAARIINVVKGGERDPDRICNRVMTDLGLQSE